MLAVPDEVSRIAALYRESRFMRTVGAGPEGVTEVMCMSLLLAPFLAHFVKFRATSASW